MLVCVSTLKYCLNVEKSHIYKNFWTFLDIYSNLRTQTNKEFEFLDSTEFKKITNGMLWWQIVGGNFTQNKKKDNEKILFLS